MDDKYLQMTNRNSLHLYKMMFPPDVQPATLAVIGCADATTSYVITTEMQARYVACVLKVNAM
jgi:hypothetical protein